jgi:hypothetical protein
MSSISPLMSSRQYRETDFLLSERNNKIACLVDGNNVDLTVYVQEFANLDALKSFSMYNGFVDALDGNGTVLSNMLASIVTLSGGAVYIMQMTQMAGHVGMGRKWKKCVR